MTARYSELLGQIKQRIKQGQTRAVFSANAEMITMYWDIGHMLNERQKIKGWGAGVIPRLARDIRNELPEIKGFSERNIGYMIRFAREYGSAPILQQPVAKLRLGKIMDTIKVPQLVAKIPWGHNVLLMEKVKDIENRFWYIQQSIVWGWREINERVF